ncbi:hypothetical protein LTR66_002199 [Elasticomyces elasticus]|nr:hypothetical protein LTR66_002199 [Elasticomyces elasticus]
MSSDSLAVFRKGLGPQLGALAEEHFKHDLEQSDRDALQSAASKLSTHTTIGSALGLGLGLFFAIRVRQNRAAMFNAFRTAERPTHIQFAGGRTEPLPDLTPFLKPTTLGDVATYLLFSAGGLFFGGELGLLSGSTFANRTISQDPESRKRIETAFRRFRADVLRKEAEALETGRMSMAL